MLGQCTTCNVLTYLVSIRFSSVILEWLWCQIYSQITISIYDCRKRNVQVDSGMLIVTAQKLTYILAHVICVYVDVVAVLLD